MALLVPTAGPGQRAAKSETQAWEDPRNGSSRKGSRTYTIGILECRIGGVCTMLYTIQDHTIVLEVLGSRNGGVHFGSWQGSGPRPFLVLEGSAVSGLL